MKIEFTKDWCLRMAQLENESGIDFEIGAGVVLYAANEKMEPRTQHPQDANIAFGRLIQLMRRKQRLTLEKLALNANIEVSEIVEIEADSHYTPEPRAVYQLANYFQVPVGKLMQLSGVTAANDAKLFEEAVRFAARSDSVDELTEQERSALAAFVSVLSEK